MAGPDAGVYPVVEDDEAEQWQEAGHHQPGPVDVVPEGANWRFLTRVFPSVLNGRILFLCDVRIRIKFEKTFPTSNSCEIT